MPKAFKFLKFTGKKAVALLAVTIVLAVSMVGATLAFIITKTDALTNIFSPAKVAIDIDDIDGNKIINTGDIPVYVRVAIVANWVNGSGEIHSTTPTVQITLSDERNWVKGSDGFYYYKLPVAANDSVTPVNSVTTSDTAPTGYEFQVQILSSAIQSTPTSAVVEAWTAVTSVNADGSLVVATVGN